MNIVYNTALIFAKAVLNLFAAGQGGRPGESKFRKFARGQRRLTARIREECSGTEDNRPTIWFHAASLGEYGVARPIIREFVKDGRWRIVLTFFSPTGCEALKDRHEGIDCVSYLPLDTRGNVRRFLDTVRPQRAVFIISEYWLNYLEELRRRSIPTFLISAVITRRAPFFKWYGRPYRKALQTYTRITVLNEESRANLESSGYTSVTVTGDPLFDNVAAAASTPYSDPTVEKFSRAAEGRIFIAGSTSDDNDIRLVTALANANPDIHFLIVPHEITPESIGDIRSRLHGRSLLHSECGPDTSFADVQTLIIDFVGALAYLYRYARWAYVGGGFTPYLHSIIEATVYGLPVAFGPEIHRKVVPEELIRLGIGRIVRTPEELCRWLEPLKDDDGELRRIKEAATSYARSKCGATEMIFRICACSQ